jgi:beta-glucan synthesis-associated protein KRE6
LRHLSSRSLGFASFLSISTTLSNTNLPPHPTNHNSTMSSNSSSPPPPRVPPHIRLNSAQEDLLTNEPYNANPASPGQPDSSRSLVPPRPTAPSLRSQNSNNGLFSGPQESAELLLPPSKLRTRRLRDEDSPIKSPLYSGFSSRRTSCSSDGGSRDSQVYGANPFGDSRSPSRAESEDDNVNTQTVSEKYNILPSASLLLFPEDVEKDDYLHNPDPNEKEKRECDIFTRRGLVNVGGLAFITIGVLILFIGYPVL